VADPHAYRIAFIGNSFLWSYDRWSTSIPGIVEHRLKQNAKPGAQDRKFVVTPYIFPGSPIVAMAGYANVVLGETHAADLVVLNVATSNLFGMSGLSASATSEQIIAAEPSWTKQLTESLREADAALRKDGITLVVVTTPLPENISPAESLWNRLQSVDGQTTASFQIGDSMNRAVKQSGVAFLDGWSVFEAESRSPQHSALFGTQDIHFSPHGRAVLANALAAYLEQTKPWRK